MPEVGRLSPDQIHELDHVEQLKAIAQHQEEFLLDKIRREYSIDGDFHLEADAHDQSVVIIYAE